MKSNPSSLSATVINYAALKSFSSSISTANVRLAMEAARRSILAAGGIDSTNQDPVDARDGATPQQPQ